MTKKERIMAKLVKDVEASYLEAFGSILGVADDGTCNFDSCMIKKIEGITYKEFEESMRKAGLNVYKPFGSGYRGWYIINKCMGQGYRNTQFAEVLRDSLKDKGYTTSVWYQMD